VQATLAPALRSGASLELEPAECTCLLLQLLLQGGLQQLLLLLLQCRLQDALLLCNLCMQQNPRGHL
jgi:hypothetical protein